MRLLFDENLPPVLVERLGGLFPGSVHVRHLNLQSAPDPVLWEFAASHGFVIVSKDADFRQRSFVYGHPPKVVWIRLGNCSTHRLSELLQTRSREINAFYLAPDASFLVLS